MTDEEEVCIFGNVFEQININELSLQIPLGELGDLSTECKPKPHKHIALGFCRKQQVLLLIFCNNTTYRISQIAHIPYI